MSSSDTAESRTAGVRQHLGSAAEVLEAAGMLAHSMQHTYSLMYHAVMHGQPEMMSSSDAAESRTAGVRQHLGSAAEVLEAAGMLAHGMQHVHSRTYQLACNWKVGLPV